MMILERWQQHKLKKIAMQNQAASPYQGYKNIQQVFLFFNYSRETEAEVLRYAKKLGDEGKQVSSLAYYPQKRKYAEQTKVSLLCKDDLNWYKRPKPDIERGYAEENFDLFVHLNENSGKAGAFVESQVTANFCCSTAPSAYKTYDLIINTESKTLQTFFKELDYYLHFINNQK